METRLALSVHCDCTVSRSPSSLRAPTMHLCSLSGHQGFLFIHSTWHCQQPSGSNLAITAWHWGPKWRAAAQLQGLSSAVPDPYTMYRESILTSKITSLTISNTFSCYHPTMFTEAHLHCSIDEIELSAQLYKELSISLSWPWCASR